MFNQVVCSKLPSPVRLAERYYPSLLHLPKQPEPTTASQTTRSKYSIQSQRIISASNLLQWRIWHNTKRIQQRCLAKAYINQHSYISSSQILVRIKITFSMGGASNETYLSEASFGFSLTLHLAIFDENIGKPENKST